MSVNPSPNSIWQKRKHTPTNKQSNKQGRKMHKFPTYQLQVGNKLPTCESNCWVVFKCSLGCFVMVLLHSFDVINTPKKKS
jgi:hypothetical protein